MRFDDYQHQAARTANARNGYLNERKVIAGLGLVGEGGEVAEIIKKEIGHGHPEDREKVAKELGDVLWYVAEVATCYGLHLGDIAAANVQKLLRRFPEGFTTEASIARVDTEGEITRRGYLEGGFQGILPGGEA